MLGLETKYFGWDWVRLGLDGVQSKEQAIALLGLGSAGAMEVDVSSALD